MFVNDFIVILVKMRTAFPYSNLMYTASKAFHSKMLIFRIKMRAKVTDRTRQTSLVFLQLLRTLRIHLLTIQRTSRPCFVSSISKVSNQSCKDMRTFCFRSWVFCQMEAKHWRTQIPKCARCLFGYTPSRFLCNACNLQFAMKYQRIWPQHWTNYQIWNVG